MYQKKKTRSNDQCSFRKLITGEVIYETANEGLATGWDEEIRVVLEAIYRFEKEQGGEKEA